MVYTICAVSPRPLLNEVCLCADHEVGERSAGVIQVERGVLQATTPQYIQQSF